MIRLIKAGYHPVGENLYTNHFITKDINNPELEKWLNDNSGEFIGLEIINETVKK